MKGKLTILILMLLNASVHSEQSLKEILTPPADSADRENLRIWLPVERNSTCRMNIAILNKHGEVVRHFLDALIPPGYFSFYWDKKDDSGKWMLADHYSYKINDCSFNDSGQLLVTYKDEEIKNKLLLVCDSEIEMVSADDTVDLKIYWFDWDGKRVAVLADTVVGPGEHRFVFMSNKKNIRNNIAIDKSVPAGTYQQVVIANRRTYHKSQINFRR